MSQGPLSSSNNRSSGDVHCERQNKVGSISIKLVYFILYRILEQGDIVSLLLVVYYHWFWCLVHTHKTC